MILSASAPLTQPRSASLNIRAAVNRVPHNAGAAFVSLTGSLSEPFMQLRQELRLQYKERFAPFSEAVMDYRDLLKRYMAFVRFSEGVSFVQEIRRRLILVRRPQRAGSWSRQLKASRTDEVLPEVTAMLATATPWPTIIAYEPATRMLPPSQPWQILAFSAKNRPKQQPGQYAN
jgi:hypothetical protein